MADARGAMERAGRRIPRAADRHYMSIVSTYRPAHAAPGKLRSMAAEYGVQLVGFVVAIAVLATAAILGTSAISNSSPLPRPAAAAHASLTAHLAPLGRAVHISRVAVTHPFAGGPMTVTQGESLSLIAKTTYPKGAACWPGVFRANRVGKHPLMGSDPNVIQVGQRLDLPRGCDSRPLPAPAIHATTVADTVSSSDSDGSDGLTAPAHTSSSHHSSGGGTTTSPPVTTSGSAEQIAQELMPSYGFSVSGQFSCLYNLWMHESGWNKYAENPGSGAYGIPQSLPGSKMASAGSDWRTNAATQIKWGLGYISAVYGTPCGAWAHEEADNWY